MPNYPQYQGACKKCWKNNKPYQAAVVGLRKGQRLGCAHGIYDSGTNRFTEFDRTTCKQKGN